MRSLSICVGFEENLIDCLFRSMRCEKSSRQVLKDL